MAQRSDSRWHTARTLLLGLLVASLGVLVVGAGTAYAELRWAVVNSDGTLSRGHSVHSTARLLTGQYEVIFTTNITKCSWVATVGVGTFGGSAGSAMITTAGRAGNVNGVYIETFDATGGFADRPFHLKVFC